jgi:predicted dehydrogenase
VTGPLRIGILGASRISPLSIVEPAAATGDRLVAVAARDPSRARDFAERYGVERVLDSYQDVVDDPEVDVVYNPLPNVLHAHWNSQAAGAGKHVLSEKPSAVHQAQAARVRDVVHAAGVVFMEAFHYPYHPLFRRLGELLDEAAIGEVEQISAILRMPAPPDSDPRWARELGGGATMDLGCYSLGCLRLLGSYAGGEPILVAAQAEERTGRPGVDERLFVDVVYPSGARGRGGSDMDSAVRGMPLVVRGTGGEITLPMFPVPHEGDSLILRRPGADDVVEHLGTRTSYTFQLEAFGDAVRTGRPVLTDADWAVGNMRLIDAAYTAAGLDVTRRSPASPPSRP